jgi:hypothetical protein
MARGHIEFIQEQDIPWKPLFARGWHIESLATQGEGVQIKTLSIDNETKACSLLMKLPAGFRREEGHYTTAEEMYILEGDLTVGGAYYRRGFYSYLPAYETQGAWQSRDGCTILVFYNDGPPIFTKGNAPTDQQTKHEERIVLDTEHIDWSPTTIPGPPPLIGHKILRFNKETKAMTFLCACVPMWDYPKIEYHDCVEEVYCIVGDIWLGNSGTMTPGSYFWRPPYYAHGPFYSKEGIAFFARTDGELINHYIDDPNRTPEQNRLEAIAKQNT